MTPLQQFKENIIAAEQLVAMYVELRRRRQLGARGRLDAANADLLWLPRSAIVASVSALDAYVHQVLYDRLGSTLRSANPPQALCDQLSQTLPIKSAGGFREALPLLAAGDTIQALLNRFTTKTLQFQAFQAPEKVEAAYNLLGYESVLSSVADIWPGPNSTAAHIRRNLNGYVKRRNQIAHEADMEANNQPRPVQPDYAIGCRWFIENLVVRLNRVVYGS